MSPARAPGAGFPEKASSRFLKRQSEKLSTWVRPCCQTSHKSISGNVLTCVVVVVFLNEDFLLWWAGAE